MASFAVQLLAFTACERSTHPQQPKLFDLLTPEQTGINFSNNLPERVDFNILNYLYYYNGAGIAVGDIDGDGLPDLYFTSNLGANRLYKNLGNYRFEDITAKAGVADSVGWKTGVTMADVNGDGKIDIYVSGVDYLDQHGRNVLYINNGDGTFTDRTSEYGLEREGFSTQALFFDYDGDGDLDVYLLDHSTHRMREAAAREAGGTAGGGRREAGGEGREAGGAIAGIGDRLLRNDGNHFTDVTAAAGIHDNADGYGLGVVASDLNADGCPDLYVTNDFQGDDYLYMNNCDGTFTEAIGNSLPASRAYRPISHTSRFSMGVDAADFNNDGWPDIVSLDMMPEREDILKTTATLEGWDIYNRRLEAGYHPQFARNMLQLNRGDGRFGEIGYYAGVFDTDWSWSALFADLDNDGEKDLFVTNGVYRRPNDMDYITYVGQEAVQRSLGDSITQANLELLKKMPSVPLANYAFRNNGNLTFTNVAEPWGLAQPGFSNGAAYVDLNNSGNLDLVVNNINAPATIYRNNARSTNGNSYLTVVLKGAAGNTQGIGAKLIAKVGATTQLLEQQPTRGFESSVDPRPHFGLGKASKIDTLTIIWPDRRYQVLADVPANQILTLSQSVATGKWTYTDRLPTPTSRRSPPASGLTPPVSRLPLFTDVTVQTHTTFTHHENTFYDYNREPLVPRLLSREGPRLAVADVNGDGLDDFFVGGAKWQTGQLFIQQPDGTFRASPQPSIAADSIAEDTGAAFLDANGDGAPDLIVVGGGNEFAGKDDPIRPRLYMNDGRGNFSLARMALPDIFENASCVTVGDFNNDGHPDVFIGSRMVAHSYGIIPRSHLLQNNGSGQFTDVTDAVAPQLGEVGMVTSATWIDYDHDGKLDLVVVGEWMPITVFHNENGKLVNRTREAGFDKTNGWWNSVEAVDLQGSGRPDLVLGNLGTNSYMRATPEEPARLYVGDFSHTGGANVDQILTFYHDGVSYPLAGRDELIARIPSLRSKYPTYKDFGASRIQDILPAAELRQAQVREADTFGSAIAINNGNGTFTLRPLPAEAQFAPIYASVAGDFDGDGKIDLVVAGNLLDVSPMLGRYDASYGLLLHGDGHGNFTAVNARTSGIAIDGQVRDIKLVRSPKGRVVAIARNNDRIVMLRVGAAAATTPSAKSRTAKPGN